MLQMLYYFRINVFEGVHQKSFIFITIGISLIIVLSFNQMSAIDALFIIDVYKPCQYCYCYWLIIENETIKILQNADLT